MGKIKDLWSKVYSDFRKPKKSLLREWVETIIIVGAAVLFIKTYIFGHYAVPTGSAETNILVGDRVIANKMAYRFFGEPQRGDCIIYDDATFKYDKSNSFIYWWQKYVGLSIPILGLPAGPDNITKRIIAAPGDKIEGRVEEGKTVVYLNDKKLDEPYVNKLPLIGLKKEVGFLNLDKIGPLKMPEFLRRHDVSNFYTYDPKVGYDKQPYYNMSEDEVLVDPFTWKPAMRLPNSPTSGEGGRVIDEFGPFIVPEGKYWLMGDNRKNSLDSRFWGFLDEDRIQGRVSFILWSTDDCGEYFWFLSFLKRPIKFWTKYVRWNRFFKNIK